jgi:hypothetical protein
VLIFAGRIRFLILYSVLMISCNFKLNSCMFTLLFESQTKIRRSYEHGWFSFSCTQAHMLASPLTFITKRGSSDEASWHPVGILKGRYHERLFPRAVRLRRPFASSNWLIFSGFGRTMPKKKAQKKAKAQRAKTQATRESEATPQPEEVQEQTVSASATSPG